MVTGPPTHKQTDRTDYNTLRRSLRAAQCNNKVNDEAEVTCSGSVFQMRVPATGKARQPMEVSRRAGTIRSSEVEDSKLEKMTAISAPPGEWDLNVHFSASARQWRGLRERRGVGFGVA